MCKRGFKIVARSVMMTTAELNANVLPNTCGIAASTDGLLLSVCPCDAQVHRDDRRQTSMFTSGNKLLSIDSCTCWHYTWRVRDNRPFDDMKVDVASLTAVVRRQEPLCKTKNSA
jgi:hypothetical protein